MHVPIADTEATALLPVDADSVHQNTAAIQDLEVVEPEALGRDQTANTIPERPWYSKPLGIVAPSSSANPSKSTPQREVLGYAGSFFYLSNALTGPGFFGFPKMLQQGGWVLSLAGLVMFTLATVYTAAFMERIIKQVKGGNLPLPIYFGNKHPESEWRFSELVRLIFTERAVFVFKVVYVGMLCMLTISCIHIAARATDSVLVSLAGNSYAITLYPILKIVASCDDSGDTVYEHTCQGGNLFYKYDEEYVFVTIGYMVLFAVSMCVAYHPLTDWGQRLLYWIGWFGLAYVLIGVATKTEWGGDIPAWPKNEPALPLEVSILTFTLSFSIPLLVHVKAKDVKLDKILWHAVVQRSFEYSVFALLFAGTFKDIQGLTAIELLHRRGYHIEATTKTIGWFTMVACVFENIVSYPQYIAFELSDVLTDMQASSIALGVPWLLSWLVYSEASYNTLVNWMASLLCGVVNFIFPLLLFRGMSEELFPQMLFKVAGSSLHIEQWRTISQYGINSIAFVIFLTYSLETSRLMASMM
uniref:Amino acid transporter transmembrane domain-containing protein n=1 Tax=Pyramimonas obovata TaxID=1411642 RepID=A0A7S0QSK1_9CHLO|mmetsp:Transcript_10093/g.21038  ORF Transcript_10093/g.21038 Transcript_10093/m.21038 type:complete len:529 (+) Transcript_10093:415-2001(+)|eukprot:CAMPEP_0118944508 /NCGR_PEP_ID=MMETSP1169-20130426/40430_1 /TAXON_ID=36882 /ORGANISM="Pyramimonas obovata, Strain CCMP722" /LENGTH=528 /DNA_ID=CAMNT_0006890007 /DNA_START=388 /DNA_END=1974 /DNA_ORIENTATION=-